MRNWMGVPFCRPQELDGCPLLSGIREDRMVWRGAAAEREPARVGSVARPRVRHLDSEPRHCLAFEKAPRVCP